MRVHVYRLNVKVSIGWALTYLRRPRPLSPRRARSCPKGPGHASTLGCRQFERIPSPCWRWPAMCNEMNYRQIRLNTVACSARLLHQGMLGAYDTTVLILVGYRQFTERRTRVCCRPLPTSPRKTGKPFHGHMIAHCSVCLR